MKLLLNFFSKKNNKNKERKIQQILASNNKKEFLELLAEPDYAKIIVTSNENILNISTDTSIVSILASINSCKYYIEINDISLIEALLNRTPELQSKQIMSNLVDCSVKKSKRNKIKKSINQLIDKIQPNLINDIKL